MYFLRLAFKTSQVLQLFCKFQPKCMLSKVSRHIRNNKTPVPIPLAKTRYDHD